MPESSLTYYPNSLCFVNPDKIKLYGNWFDSKFKNIEIIFTACDQDTYSGTCKTPDEIDLFLKSNAFYLITQRTFADKSIYMDKQDIDFSDNGDKKFYYPLTKIT